MISNMDVRVENCESLVQFAYVDESLKYYFLDVIINLQVTFLYDELWQ